MSKKTRKPAAFTIDDPQVRVQSAPNGVEPVSADDMAPEPLARPRLWRWGRLFTIALGALLGLWVTLRIEAFVRALFSRQDWLGWLALVLAALVAFAALMMILREIIAIARQRRVVHIRAALGEAHRDNDSVAAARAIGELLALYGNRPDTARSRHAVQEHRRAVMDASDAITLAERDLIRPLDLRARALVLKSAKRVSIVTAVSPRALVDLAFVLWQTSRLVRDISTLYGARPGAFGMWRLAGRIVSHLAITGGIAIGESLVQQMIGQGLAARLSARLGEGVVNGVLTARVGIAAIEVCRPMPFIDETAPVLSDFLSDLMRSGG